MKHYVEIAISGPLRKTFTYSVSESDFQKLRPGMVVTAPFGRRRVRGFYLGERDNPGYQVKEITLGESPLLAVDPEYFEFYRWLADYYFCNIADVLSLALPPEKRRSSQSRIYLNPDLVGQSSASLAGVPDRILRRLRAEKHLRSGDIKEIDTVTVPGVSGLLQAGALVERTEAVRPPRGRLAGSRVLQPEVVRSALECDSAGIELSEAPIARSRLKDAGLSDYRISALCESNALERVYAVSEMSQLIRSRPRADVNELKLNEDQLAAFSSVASHIGRKFKSFLLHGVTGSGKTLVYAKLAEEALKRGLSTLILAPEIALAGEILNYIRNALTAEVVLWSSAMGAGERAKVWRRVSDGKARILVGPRSAIFAPLKDIGLIVVDEEHDESYKQSEPSPRFHGRDAAVMLARTLNIPILLGSGTPSLESYHNVRTGRYELLQMKSRPTGVDQPQIDLIDMRRESDGSELSIVSSKLASAVEDRLSAGQQVILYLNRRGFSPRVRCRDCGATPSCPDCDLPLTYHRRGERLICHLCGFTQSDYQRCSACGSRKLSRLGAGTQRLEGAVAKLFPSAKVVRLDTDAVTREGVWRTLAEFAEGKHNLLLGTQMISKGIDIPGVSLVAAITADAEVDLSDFRASEKTFAKLTQVAGRSGRTGKRGLAFVQTYNPQSELMQAIVAGDYHVFFNKELDERRRLGLPPYSRVARIILSSPNEKLLTKSSEKFDATLRKNIRRANLDAVVVGPAPCPIYKLRGRFRMYCTVRLGSMTRLGEILTEWESKEARFRLPSEVRVAVDIDACDFM